MSKIAQVLLSDGIELERIGMIGLGTGALAAYTHKGQMFDVYELDPDNLPIARENFTYLDIAENNGAKLNFIFGDGRIALRDKKERSYDLFIVDAFNSGSIPVHLVTVEAIEEYLRVLKDDGFLLMHVSNKILDLLPVVYSNAEKLGVWACDQSNEDNIHPDAELTLWMALSKDKSVGTNA